MTQLQKRSARTVSIILFILPALCIYSLFFAYPALSALRYSFYSWNGIGDMKWVGLGNFIKLFTEAPWNAQWLNALLHNLLVLVEANLIQTPLALLFALLLHQRLFGFRFFRTVLFLPVVLSSIAVSFIWSMMLNPMAGVINVGLQRIGLGVLAMPWLGDPTYALTVINLIGIWKGMALPMLLFLANLQSIDQALIDAATVDGASGWQVLCYIRFPLLAPSLTVVTLLTFVGCFGIFDFIYVLEGAMAGPFGSTDVLETLFYRNAFGGVQTGGGNMGDFGFACTIGLVTAIIVMSIGFTGLKKLRSREGAISR
jgi:raffinose/stachyose/melibiose transport system permease protein